MSIFQTLLIDADILAFKVAAKSETKVAFPGCEPQWDHLEWDQVKPAISEVLDTWVEKAGGGKPLICLSAPSAEGWRVKVLPTYKANRKDAHRPHWLGDVKQYLEDNYPSYRRPALEADDIMGILATDPTLVPGKKVIVSSDKDMLTIPAWVCNPDSLKRPRRVPEDEANWWHLYQTIVGDPTDGYQGCPGAGPVNAWKALDADLGDYSGADAWDAVVDLYGLRGFKEEEALIQARVARICRASDYNFKTKEVILWTPSSLC